MKEFQALGLDISIINEDGEALGLKQIEESDEDNSEPLNEEVNITKISTEEKEEVSKEADEENIIDVENELSKGDEE